MENTLEHFFKIHGQVNGFGSKSIEKLVAAGINTLEKIYNSSVESFQEAGFGPGQSKNLRAELDRSILVETEDWRFLAAFGIPQLGQGDSRRLLQHIRLNDLAKLTLEKIMAIDGFAEISSADILGGLTKKRPIIKHMLSLGFNIYETPLLEPSEVIKSPITGMKIVFTGKMIQGSRNQMKKDALQLGAKVQSSVSTKTDILICGEKVGSAKISKAQKLGVQIMSENEYVVLLQDQ